MVRILSGFWRHLYQTPPEEVEKVEEPAREPELPLVELVAEGEKTPPSFVEETVAPDNPVPSYPDQQKQLDLLQKMHEVMAASSVTEPVVVDDAPVVIPSAEQQLGPPEPEGRPASLPGTPVTPEELFRLLDPDVLYGHSAFDSTAGLDPVLAIFFKRCFRAMPERARAQLYATGGRRLLRLTILAAAERMLWHHYPLLGLWQRFKRLFVTPHRDFVP